MTRILLVDDDDHFRRMLLTTLEKMGHEVLEARNGKEALILCETGQPSLLLLDIFMPEKDGLETIAELRKMVPPHKVIAMSGGSRGSATDYLKLAKRLGATSTLNKPFTTEELSAAITAALAPK